MVEAAGEGGAAALGRPRDGEGVALGKPKDGEGKLGSDTAEGKVGKLLMCSLFREKSRERWVKIFHNYEIHDIKGKIHTLHKNTETHLTDPGLENRLFCGCCVGTAVGIGIGAGAVARVGPCSLAESVCAISTVPLPASDPKSSAPNCTFRPDTSAEPGISTAEDGI